MVKPIDEGESGRAKLSAEESLKRMQEFGSKNVSRKENFMTARKPKPLYHRLVVVADPKITIWLVDDCWHPVQKAIGTLDTSVQHGRYFIEMGANGPKGVAYPIELFSDLRVTQDLLEVGPACQRQAPKLLDE
ncbi:MAG TPA: hypothetical protein VN688_24875 [Gemmataceae bacterium]|nr:hypothetical protein [Gemmataceae bacterium]